MRNKFESGGEQHEHIADVIDITDVSKRGVKRVLDLEQRGYFTSQAAYWCEVEEMAQRQLDYARSQREYALQMLGMIPDEGGYPE